MQGGEDPQADQEELEKVRVGAPIAVRRRQPRRPVQISYVVLLGGKSVAEQLLYFLATVLGPIAGNGKMQGMCSPAQRWSRCWLAGVDLLKEGRWQ